MAGGSDGDTNVLILLSESSRSSDSSASAVSNFDAVAVPIFSKWLSAEALNMGSQASPLDVEPLSGVVCKHAGYARMCAEWDAMCSCGHMRRGGSSACEWFLDSMRVCM